MSYTVIGDSVNLASRIEGVNKGYKTKILITEETYQLVQNDFEFRAIDYVTVKGKSKAVKIYELIAEKNQIQKEQVEFNAQFSKEVDIFFEGNYSQAQILFLALSKKNQTDFVTSLYLSKCSESLQISKKSR